MPTYINPETGKEDPSITDRAVTVVFRYASDDTSDPEMRGDLTDHIDALADTLGMDYEIHPEDLTSS